MYEERANKIRRASRLLSILCLAGVGFIPLIVSLIWFLGDDTFFRSGEPTMYLVPHGYALYDAPFSPSVRLLGFLVSMIPNVLLIFSLWHLKRLFEEFQRLKFFTPSTSHRLKGFALNILLYAIIYPLAGGLLSLVTSIQNSPGHRMISITAGDSQLFAIFLGLVILVVSWVMGEGSRLAEENEQFV